MADGGGGSTPQVTPWNPPGGIDENQLAQFLQTDLGKKYNGTFPTGGSVYQQGTGPDTKLLAFPAGYNGNPSGGVDVTQMMTDFGNWGAGMAQTQANWKNYAKQADLFQGGEGDQTITGGAAQSQRSALLGALSGAGTNTPTPGLGTFGALQAAKAVKK